MSLCVIIDKLLWLQYLTNHVGPRHHEWLPLPGGEVSRAKPDLAPPPNFFALEPGLLGLQLRYKR